MKIAQRCFYFAVRLIHSNAIWTFFLARNSPTPPILHLFCENGKMRASLQMQRNALCTWHTVQLAMLKMTEIIIFISFWNSKLQPAAEFASIVCRNMCVCVRHLLPHKLNRKWFERCFFCVCVCVQMIMSTNGNGERTYAKFISALRCIVVYLLLAVCLCFVLGRFKHNFFPTSLRM